MAEPRDLCTLEEVRDYLGLKSGETDTDLLLAELISDISEAVYDASGRREFISYDAAFTGPQGALETPSTTRVFYTELETDTIRVGDLDVLESISTGVTPVAVDIAGVIGLPSPRPPDRPIRRLKLPSTYIDGALVSVTGKWGWPAVPAPIKRATIAEVCVWMERDVAQFSETFSLEEGRTVRPRALSSKVYDIVARYRPVGPVFV